MSGSGVTYKDSGVDIEAGYEVVRRIKEHTRSTFRPEVVTDIGSFGGFFALAKYKDPVLVAGTDGVGTKLKIAFLMDKHDTVGIDLVAYSVNDIICHGAEPLFFLDYLATGKVEPEKIEQLVKGVSEGCKMAGCSLIGGETAEMPGFYPDGEYDMAGFAVGVVEREKLINGSRTAPGDVIVGIGSTGLQSNGYALVRKVVFEVCGHKVTDYVEELGRSIGEELLEPTRVYARQILTLAKEFDVKGIANITGGGLPENVSRSISPDCTAVIRKGTWPVLPIFYYLQKRGNITETEMFRTFNMGIGMCVIVPESQANDVVARLEELGENGYLIGHLEKGEHGVRIV
jgi:phosphoribosylformylglycinamidine cyclo-ligase